MNKDILEIIYKEFRTEDQELVIKELTSITLKHVMAESEQHLVHTRLSVLKLAQGDLDEVISYTKFAKIDFRDVLLWAHESK